jgi:hypothetical protein
MIKMFASALLTVLFCCRGVFAQDIDNGLDYLPQNHINIASVKAEHYAHLKIFVLPIYIGSDTIGPGTFVAIDNIFITGNARVELKPGTTILFEPGKRLTVEGELFAVGEKERPIVFNNVPLAERYIKVATVDSLWGGIESKPGSTLTLKNVTLKNSFGGVNAPAKGGTFECLDLASVAGAMFSVAGKPELVVNPDCFNFPIPAVKNVSDGKPRKHWTKGRVALTTTTGILLAGAVSAAFILNNQGFQYHNNANNATTSADATDYLAKSKTAFDRRDIGWIVSGIMAAGVVLSITIPIGR